MDNKIRELIIKQDCTVADAIKAIMKNACGIAFITDNKGCFVSVVTDGDIRKAMLEGRQTYESVLDIASPDPVFVRDTMSENKVINFLKTKSLTNKMQFGGTVKIPVLDREKKIVNVLFVSAKGDDIYLIVNDFRHIKEAKKLSGPASVLVTGGAGYLGSVLCRKLLERNYKVKVLDNLMFGDQGIKQLYKNKEFELIRGDVRDLQVVVEAIKGVDAVIHLAAIVGDPMTTRFPQESIDVNYLATKAIVDACKYYQLNRFIYASTCSVYGKAPNKNGKLSIDSQTKPLSLYAKMKLASENAILSLADDSFSPIILRMSTLYGLSPRMRFDLAVNILTAQAFANKKVTIFGGEQWRPFLHVDDAAAAYIKCLELPLYRMQRRIFNLGTDNQNYQLYKVGQMIKELLPEVKIAISKKKVDPRNYNVSFSDSIKFLGFNARYDVYDGIKEIKDSMRHGNYSDYENPKYNNLKAKLAYIGGDYDKEE